MNPISQLMGGMGGGMSGGMPGMGGSTGGMPQTPGSSQMNPGGDQMMQLLQMMGDPMGLAGSTQGGSQPLSPQIQAILAMLTKSGQVPPSNQQVPQMMQLAQMLGQQGGGMGGPQMGGPPMQQPPMGGGY